MESIGTIVVYIIMGCAIAGAIASVVRPESELGKEFVAGIDSLGPIFLPVAGIMASAPFLTAFVSNVFGPVYSAVGADPAMAPPRSSRWTWADISLPKRLLKPKRAGSWPWSRAIWPAPPSCSPFPSR